MVPSRAGSTGVANQIGDFLLHRSGGSETKLLVLLMLSAAGLGSVMSSTGVVAIFIPVVLLVAARRKLSPGRLMMPLAYAGLISGMLTLVGTAPNLVVDSALRHAGHAGFGFFSFTPFGAVRCPSAWVTSSRERSSMGMPLPSLQARSTVEVGAAT